MAMSSDALGKAFSADPAPLGLSGFAMTTFLLSIFNAGLLTQGAGVVIPFAFAYGGTAQFVAGVFEMRRGNTFAFTAFCSYGAFWWFYALLFLFPAATVAPTAAAIGWALVIWGFFTLYMWAGAMHINLTLNLTFLFLWLAFFVLGYGAVYGSTTATHAGGYLGFLAAFFAAYTAFAIIVNSVWGKTIIPTGPGIGQAKTGGS